uniref:Uncharacterized protein n=1 Tax=Arundo donax TaxID=35708 RepID=A0A0A9B916_ARUDO
MIWLPCAVPMIWVCYLPCCYLDFI